MDIKKGSMLLLRYVAVPLLVAFIMTVYIVINLGIDQFSYSEIAKTFLSNLFFTFFFYTTNASLGELMGKRMKPGFWSLTFALLILTAVNTILSLILIFAYIYIKFGRIADISNPEFQSYVWLSATISSSISILVYIVGYINRTSKKEIEKTQLKAEKAIQSNELLESQIGPHFLFNSLNVLSGLMDENKEKAHEFVNELSDIYRYVLEYKDQSVVSLEEEIQFCKNYLNLVQKRFEDGLSYHIALQSAGKFYVVPLSIQILIENCIKHNKLSAENPLIIEINQMNGFIEVRNNYQPKPAKSQSTGKGLQSIVKRYGKLTDKEVKIDHSPRYFIVQLPLLTEKTEIMETISHVEFSEEDYKYAKAKVKKRTKFLTGLATYFPVNLFLLYINLKFTPDYLWVIWPILGWGLGLALEAIKVYGFFNEEAWQEKQIQKELKKRQKKN